MRCAGGGATAIAPNRPGNNSLPVQLPSSGLDSGDWMQHQCTEDLGGALGSEAIVCLHGKPHLFGQCVTTTQCSARDVFSTEAKVIMIALGGVALLCLCMGLALFATAVFWRQRQSQHV